MRSIVPNAKYKEVISYVCKFAKISSFSDVIKRQLMVNAN